MGGPGPRHRQAPARAQGGRVRLRPRRSGHGGEAKKGPWQPERGCEGALTPRGRPRARGTAAPASPRAAGSGCIPFAGRVLLGSNKPAASDHPPRT
eukprot:4963635-Pyramimonas_sp.AAC.1